MQTQGYCSLHFNLTDGRVVRHHLDQIRPRLESTDMNSDNPTCEADDPLMNPTSSCSQADPLQEQGLGRDALLNREAS